MSAPTVARAAPFPTIVAFFRRHPVLLLLCLTPGIPEYLSGSSALADLVIAPPVFFIFLALNLGLYGPGVLLIREALIRWNKGWAAVLCLGSAYALLEEGTGLSTLFDPKASVVGNLGMYGHSLGVSWVWAIGVLQIHIVLSIGLPILLLGLALPETRGRSFLNGRQIALVLGIFAFDIFFLLLISHYYPVGLLWQLLAIPVAAALAGLAYYLPRDLLNPTSATPTLSLTACFVLGFLFFPIIVLVPGLGEHTSLGAPLVGALEIAASGGLFLLIRRGIGRTHNEAQLVMVAFGALVPIAFFGLVGQIFVPVVVVADVFFALFFYTLWQRYRPGPAAPGVPTGAV